jgi:hypothetical protein
MMHYALILLLLSTPIFAQIEAAKDKEGKIPKRSNR